MKKIKFILFFSFMIIFLLIPFPSSDMIIRVKFSEVVGNTYQLYYSTEGNSFSGDKFIPGEINYDKKLVSFKIDGSNEGLTGLRLDFPDTSELICIEKITASSAGIIQKQFDPSNFFDSQNIIATNNIAAISLSTAQDKAFIAIDGFDPYIIFSDNIVQEFNSSFSHIFLSRLGICLFILATFFFTKKNYFSS